ncbi:MAG: hypothetical protein AAB250_19535 [Bdellovibrionota bacterium]
MTSAQLLAAVAFISATALGMSTAPTELCEGFLPANTMRIPVGTNETNSSEFAAKRTRKKAPVGSLTEAQFNEVMDRIEKFYTPVVAKAGGKLTVNRLWKDATVNASAQQMGNSWVINMYGGLARHPQVTVEGMALVACHEMGHHLGGAPKVSGWFGDDWATNEGGSDYYATMKCLREYFAEDDNAAVIKVTKIDATATKLCKAQWNTPDEIALCQRISLAGSSVAYLFQDLSKEKTKPEFDTPDKAVVTEMDDAHPATQCRMDTYLAGLSCTVDKSVPVSDTDYKEGSCVEGTHDVGFRPRCWFFAE